MLVLVAIARSRSAVFANHEQRLDTRPEKKITALTLKNHIFAVCHFPVGHFQASLRVPFVSVRKRNISDEVLNCEVKLLDENTHRL